MRVYGKILGDRLKRFSIALNIVAGLVVILFLINSVLVSYIKYQNGVMLKLNDILAIANRLESDKNKMLEVNSKFQKMIEGYASKFYGVASIYRAYDEIAYTVKGFSIDLVPVKVENNIIRLPITIKGKVKDRQLIAGIADYLQGFNYPFVNVPSISIKMDGDGLDVTMTGEIISYDMKGIL